MATSRRLPLVPGCTADCCRFSAKPREESTQLQPTKKIPAVVDTLFKKSLRVGMVAYLFSLLSVAHLHAKYMKVRIETRFFVLSARVGIFIHPRHFPVNQIVLR